MIDETPFEDGTEGLEAYIKREHLRERENFELNKKQIKSHYEGILTKFSSATLQEAMLYRTQCSQIVTILKGANEIYNKTYVYETELNQLAVEYRNTYICKFEELLVAIEKTIEYKEFKARAANSPDYLLPLSTLQNIHLEFDGILWDTIKLNIFYTLFDINNNNKEDFKIIKKSNFYALLWKMYNASEKHVTQEQFIKPFLERYDCKYSSYQNIKQVRIDSSKPNDKKLMKQIEKTMK